MHPYFPKGKPHLEDLLRNEPTVGGATGTALFLKGDVETSQNEQFLEGIVKIGFWFQIKAAASIEPEEYIGISRI